ncbi:SDR family oxidoreductase [Actinospongicola halichondriae]|uniref:SDR family oxidoreductase n=1 Tax=Actinospongicola halichondriae TaxID=3236844 RepID=UPI003D51AB89
MGTAVITGCSSGFGLGTAVELAMRGHRVFASMRDPERGGALRDEAERAGVDVEIVTLDVGDEDSVRAAVAQVVDAAGGIDIVVNNAGIEVRGPIHLISDREARAQFDTNVFGVLNVVRATVPHLRDSADGVIVNVSSIAGVMSRPFAGIYAASKHAVEAITEALHFELGLEGIRVHAIEPGQFDTALAANTTTASDFTEAEEPHWTMSQALDERVHGLVPGGERADPHAVVLAIADAVADDSTPLRIPVGGDTELILAARSGNSFEEYEITMRTFLDFWEGHRSGPR